MERARLAWHFAEIQRHVEWKQERMGGRLAGAWQVMGKTASRTEDMRPPSLLVQIQGKGQQRDVIYEGGCALNVDVRGCTGAFVHAFLSPGIPLTSDSLFCSPHVLSWMMRRQVHEVSVVVTRG